MSERLTLTVEEAAQLLGVSRGSAYEAARTGALPVVRIGRRVLVPTHALLSLLNVDEPAANGPAAKLPDAPGHGQG